MNESGRGAYSKHNRNKKRSGGGGRDIYNGYADNRANGDSSVSRDNRDSGNSRANGNGSFNAGNGSRVNGDNRNGKQPPRNPNNKSQKQNQNSKPNADTKTGAYGQDRGRNQRKDNKGPFSGARDFGIGRNKVRPDDKNRPKWTPPELLREPLPMPVCPVCGKVISEPACAVTDKLSGEAAHFDCVREKLAVGEELLPGEELTYIGGGRFGVVSFEGGDKRRFKIKKIIEYEITESRADWRGNIADHYSLT
jgi:hypothetical protein